MTEVYKNKNESTAAFLKAFLDSRLRRGEGGGGLIIGFHCRNTRLSHCLQSTQIEINLAMIINDNQ